MCIRDRPTTGARVLINANSQLRCGTLSDVSTKTVDVMYDDGEDADDLDRRRVILVVNDAELQCSLYLNLAKCGLKVNRLRDSTSAATLAGGLVSISGGVSDVVALVPLAEAVSTSTTNSTFSTQQHVDPAGSVTSQSVGCSPGRRPFCASPGRI